LLLQISEPDSAQVPQRERKRGLGIDLGTTNSLVAVKTESGVEVIKDATGEVLLPSVVNFGEVVLVGHEAKATASSDPKNTIVSAKRLMGTFARRSYGISDDGFGRVRPARLRYGFWQKNTC
jgi:molecular chaperone HscA